MKILFITPYITIDEIASFSKNQTGFGYMVRDIAESVAKNEIVDLITFSSINDSFVYNGINILKHKWKDFFLNFKVKYFFASCAYLKKYPVPIKEKLIVLYYFVSVGYIETLLKKGYYDIVHIHGCGTITEAVMKCCNDCHAPFVITFHGLNSFSDSIKLVMSGKKYEKDFLLKSYIENIPVTFISSGLVYQTQDYLKSSKIPNHYIITNGCDVSPKEEKTFDLRNKYNIPNEAQILLFVGNISKNKNQIQLARAYNKLPEKIKESVYILFIGQFSVDCEIDKYIQYFNLQDHLILCGAVAKDKIHNFYKQSGYTVLLSVSEGFGLSIIEGFVYGLPNLTFSDLAAMPDLYNPNAMIALTQRTDDEVKNGIIEMLDKKWDREFIKSYSSKFSLEKMAKNYISVYKNVIANYEN